MSYNRTLQLIQFMTRWSFSHQASCETNDACHACESNVYDDEDRLFILGAPDRLALSRSKYPYSDTPCMYDVSWQRSCKMHFLQSIIFPPYLMKKSHIIQIKLIEALIINYNCSKYNITPNNTIRIKWW